MKDEGWHEISYECMREVNCSSLAVEQFPKGRRWKTFLNLEDAKHLEKGL